MLGIMDKTYNFDPQVAHILFVKSDCAKDLLKTLVSLVLEASYEWEKDSISVIFIIFPSMVL